MLKYCTWYHYHSHHVGIRTVMLMKVLMMKLWRTYLKSSKYLWWNILVFQWYNVRKVLRVQQPLWFKFQEHFMVSFIPQNIFVFYHLTKPFFSRKVKKNKIQSHWLTSKIWIVENIFSQYIFKKMCWRFCFDYKLFVPKFLTWLWWWRKESFF